MSAKLPSHPATLPPASVTAKEEKMVTSSECRRVNHASVTTGRDRIVPSPSLDQGGNLCRTRESRHHGSDPSREEHSARHRDSRPYDRQVRGTSRNSKTMNHAPISLSEDNPRIRPSEREHPGKDPRGHIEINVV